MSEIVAISLFSGCGGLDIGTEQAGISVISAIDFNSDAIETLRNNEVFEKTELFCDDIVTFDKNIFVKQIASMKPDKFIIVGGPPCQPFSKGGYWVTNDKRKKDKDPRNMVGEYFKTIELLKPNGFIFENVESLLHPTNKHTASQLMESFKTLGYYCLLLPINAQDFGVPQKRKRVFIIGSRKPFKKLFPSKTHYNPVKETNKLLKPYESVGKHIAPFSSTKYKEANESVVGGTYEKELFMVPPGKNYIALSEKYIKKPLFKSGTRFWNFLLKLHPDMPSWTICAQPGPWVGPFHWDSRRLRVPEIAAIQTFPKNYKFYGTRRSVQQQIGNAVPPLLAKKMLEFLKENL